MEKLMNYSSVPFKEGDVVECISDERPEFYEFDNWTQKDGISAGDRLVVKHCEENVPDNFAVVFDGKIYNHDARLFKLVDSEPAAPSDSSDRLESALKFLETSGDVFQALKIAAGVQ